MSFVWKRPSSVSSPLDYIKFQALDSANANKVTYTIRDLERDRFDDVLTIMKDKHLLDEPMYLSKGCKDDLISFQEMVGNWTNMLNQHVSLVCFEEGSDEIVAVNILGVVTEKEFDAPHNVSLIILSSCKYFKKNCTVQRQGLV